MYEEVLETCQKRLTAIKKNIDVITDLATRQEFTYWLKKSLSMHLFEKCCHKEELTRIKAAAELLTLFLDNGAYLKSNYDGETLFGYPLLDEKLYQRLEKAGLKPNSEALISAIYHNANTALDTLLKHDINIHKQLHSGGVNAFVKYAIDRSNTYALRRLLQKGIDINQKDKNGQTLIEYLVKSGTTREVEKRAFYLLIGQQPEKLPVGKIGDFNYDHKVYHDLTKIQSRKDLKEWCYHHVNYEHAGKISSAFIEFGTTQQFRDGVARLTTNYKRYAKMTHQTSLKPKTFSDIYTKFCLYALEHGADMGFFRLLSLGVQQQCIQEWMFEKGRTGVPENMFSPYKKDQKEIFEKFKNSKWPIGDYEMRYVKLAFVPLVIQSNLKKILGTDQQKPKLRDITVRW